MKFFRLRCLACEWNRAVFASPLESQLMRDQLLAIVRCSDERANECFLSCWCSHLSWLDRVQASCAISNWWRTFLAKPSWELTWPTFLWLQLCRPLTVALNFLARVAKGQVDTGTDVQASSTVSWEPSNLVQKASKWNVALPGLTALRLSKSGDGQIHPWWHFAAGCQDPFCRV